MAPQSREIDERFMRRALQLAERGRGRTWPNPAVGAVLVRGGKIVGEGWHRAVGLPHAVAIALERAGNKARGATLYVTLEPCAHAGRTPPCASAIIAAGVARCVVAVRDPHAIVDGRGLAALRRAGLAVEVGVCADEACEVLGGNWLRHAEERPRVTWKVAATLDGRIADAKGNARWITGPEARARGHALRVASQAIIIGAGTARSDDPRLTARHAAALSAANGRGPQHAGELRQPLRVVCDTRLRLPLTLKLFAPPLAKGTVVACGPLATKAREAALIARGVGVWRLPLVGGGVSPRALARRLAREECQEVLLEGGAALGTAWLKASQVDRIMMFLAPKLLGGGLVWCGPFGRGRLAKAIEGRIESCETLGADVLITVGLR